MSWPETVRKADLKIDWFSGTGGGGQHRNKHANCCRMTHLPTGIRTTGQSNRERPSNRREAWDSLAEKLVPLMRADATRDDNSKSDERIRTYHEPQQRVTDHRVPGQHFNFSRTLDGDLGPIIRALKANPPEGDDKQGSDS